MTSTSEGHPLLLKVDRFLHAARIAHGARVLVACSGGPDSTALLAALRSLPTHRLVLEACYVDHGLKGSEEIDAEIELVSSLARRFDVPFTLESFEPGAVERAARSARGGLEEAARTLRYRALRRVAAARGLELIAVGHTLDDQIETVLMRVLEGAGLGGLGGIPPVSRELIRPLAEVGRDEVLDYLRRERLEYHIDSTNEADAFLRNRVRHDLIPAIRAHFPGFQKSLARLARDARDANALLDAAAAEIEWSAEPSGYRTDAARFFGEPPAVRLRSLERLLNREGVGGRVPAAFWAPLCRPDATAAEAARRRLLRGRGIEVELEAGTLHLKRSIVRGAKKSYLIEAIDGGYFRIDESFAFRIVRERGAMLPRSRPLIEHDMVKYPLIVRSGRPGDRIATVRGIRDVKKLLGEWRVPRDDRWRVPVVEDRDGIIAVLGRAVGARDEVGARARGTLGDPSAPRWSVYFSEDGVRS